ncbi:EamA family transporter [Falsiroseomonas sp. E2-1-a20]|uniref:EamA family transporter n=1 Tax=Falsiroseomonas sp. E2-1-a20 TaxID=3239300 RepID=UPI003F2DE60D
MTTLVLPRPPLAAGSAFRPRPAPPAAQADAIRSGVPLGIAAAVAAATIWGGALAMTRLGVSGAGTLAAHDIAMLRFVGPALVLLPVLLRALPKLRAAGAWPLLLLLAGGGAPFVLVAGHGLRVAEAAEAGALLPGTAPLCVAVVAALLGERFGRLRLLGLALIGFAIVAVAGPALAEGAAEARGGHALLLAAAMLAAAYTLALRRAGLSAWEATAFVSVASVVTLGPIYLLVLEPGIAGASWREIAVQATYQGGVSGVIAPVAFATAVTRLGAVRAAAFGGLSPVAAALIGFVLLGEMPGPATALALLAASLGVVLVSRPAARTP